jgi:hypothetical protein
MTKSDKERYWEKVDRGTKDECWEWTASTANGYGRFHIDDGLEYAHRLSLRFDGVELDEESNVLHKCDNRLCVNPNHLYLGDQSDNLKDARNREHLEHQLTQDEVDEIRRKYESDDHSQYDLAAEYGVTQQAISCIVREEVWV